MLQNRTLTTLALAGLLLPITMVLVRQFDYHFGQDPEDCTVVAASLEPADQMARLPSQPFLILGEGAARHWPDTITHVGDRPLLVRSTPAIALSTAAACFDRLIAFYHPASVILMPETRDLERLETELADQLRAIAKARAHYEIEATIYVSGFLRTPARDNGRINRLNRALADASARLEGIGYIDPNPPFGDSAGSPSADFFWPDGDTLRAHSYPLLAEQFAAALQSKHSDNEL